jgi:hypothetical protein
LRYYRPHQQVKQNVSTPGNSQYGKGNPNQTWIAEILGYTATNASKFFFWAVTTKNLSFDFPVYFYYPNKGKIPFFASIAILFKL